MEKILESLVQLILDLRHFKITEAVRNNEEAADELLNWTRNNAAHNQLRNHTVNLVYAISFILTAVFKYFINVLSANNSNGCNLKNVSYLA